jgi:hypothetical protein
MSKRRNHRISRQTRSGNTIDASRPTCVAEPLERRVLFNTYTVTTLGDATGPVLPEHAMPGQYFAPSLRSAILAANASPGADTIKFSPALLGTIFLNSALPPITDTLTVDGPGLQTLTVARRTEAPTNFSIFHIDAGKTVHISGLTITRGTGDTVDNVLVGGGIYNAGTLTLTDCEVTGNIITITQAKGSAFGGGIDNRGTLTLKDCQVSGNMIDGPAAGASGEGGGIYNGGTATVNNSTVSGNTALNNGGGIQNDGNMSLNISTVTGNSASSGGGIQTDGVMSIANCDIAANHANTNSGAGGDINNDGTLTATISSFTGGSAFSGAGIQNNKTATLDDCEISKNNGTNGGGAANSGSLTLVNCSVTGNTALYGGGVLNGLGKNAHCDIAGCDISYNNNNHVFGYGDGGGIDNGAGDVLTLTNSTVSGNVMYGANTPPLFGYGGGVQNSGQATITNCTITRNVAGTSGGGINVAAGSVILENTIVANNGFDDINGFVALSSSCNLIGSKYAAGGLLNGLNGNKVGYSANQLHLGPLAYHGGLTETIALQSGSPAINAGSDSDAMAAKLFSDQRGLPRFNNGHVDIGAYQTQPAGGASIAGVVYNDLNDNGSRQLEEPGLGGWQVYIDHNDSGAYVAGDIYAITNSAGAFKLTGLTPGTYIIREVPQAESTRTQPAGAGPLGFYKVAVGLNGAIVGNDFGNSLG